MTTRVLPHAEWPRLEGFALYALIKDAPAGSVWPIVVEDDGQIVGCWGLISWLHAEGVEIAPAYRGKTVVARRLLAGMNSLADELGITTVVTGAESDLVRGILEKLGAERWPDLYSLPVGKTRVESESILCQ
jgi:RimJ/RimL family protein N-acetyltransferase